MGVFASFQIATGTVLAVYKSLVVFFTFFFARYSPFDLV